jgi:hypothetical protein
MGSIVFFFYHPSDEGHTTVYTKGWACYDTDHMRLMLFNCYEIKTAVQLSS